MEGPLSGIQTEQTDGRTASWRTESSHGRQKAYSSLESSLGNSLPLTHTNFRRCTSAAPIMWVAHSEPNTHT